MTPVEDSPRVGVDGIAQILGISYLKACRILSRRAEHDFPEPVEMTADRTRWDASAVLAWGARPIPDPRPWETSWPAPEVPWRDAEPSEVPRGATVLMRAAAPGWECRVTYARGTPPDQYGRPAPVAELAVLRAQRGAQRLWGMWKNGRYAAGSRFGTGTPERLTSAGLRSILTQGGP